MNLRVVFLFCITCLIARLSNAQEVEFSQGFNSNYFKQSSNQFLKGENKFSLGYNFGVEYTYRSKRGYRMKSYVGFMHINSEYRLTSNDGNYISVIDIHINTNYLVIGWKPFNFLVHDDAIEVSAGFDSVSRIKDRSIIRESYSTNNTLPFPGSNNSGDNFTDYGKLKGNLALNFGLAYRIPLSDNTLLIPRINYRLVKLFSTFTRNNNIIGLELGFWYQRPSKI